MIQYFEISKSVSIVVFVAKSAKIVVGSNRYIISPTLVKRDFLHEFLTLCNIYLLPMYRKAKYKVGGLSVYKYFLM